jgi:rhodanese-related sulfurtransferase
MSDHASDPGGRQVPLPSGGKDYAGDLGPEEAWRVLRDEADSVLVDVRTDAEWTYVGLPDLSGLGKETVCVAWQVFPRMGLNPHFLAEIAARGVRREQTLLLLCRSGVRSRHAAAALTGAGFARCYNVAEGFEGDRDEAHHRGRRGGWKVRGLPWVQS